MIGTPFFFILTESAGNEKKGSMTLSFKTIGGKSMQKTEDQRISRKMPKRGKDIRRAGEYPVAACALPVVNENRSSAFIGTRLRHMWSAFFVSFT
jgi:hypothetical protein